MTDLKKWQNITMGGINLDAGSSVKNCTASFRKGKKPEFLEKTCINCFFCWVFCPDNAIMVSNEKVTGIKYDFCKGCGICVNECPVKTDPRPLQMIDENVDFEKDFFGVPSHLTVSGQLEAEIYALSMGDVYTFGPTFRAENSNTSRHLAEFWMIEPEMAFCDLEGNVELAVEFIKYILKYVLENCAEDMDLFNRFIDKTIINTLEQIVEQKFKRLNYSEAIDILTSSGESFEFPVKWGNDLRQNMKGISAKRYSTNRLF